ncbi:hypothetical protein ISG33_12120 [Glaciecola sp. MH2013]|uniref:hypothetical protein n=1 Tax=Glaciecola sp. MH2013 TaxID=2785524 RepID=UPI0018A10018|nr:hypothetical protein [Glaciecola sp. MH2013]MBF7074147.1 hypothetical protein [Glaciecola sp. MH2013]
MLKLNSGYTKSQRGKAKVSSLFIPALALCVVAALVWVLYSLFQPVKFEPGSTLAESEPYNAPEPEYQLAQNNTRAEPLKKPDTVPEEIDSNLSYCAAPDVEIVGFEWDTNMAQVKTDSLNWQEITNENLFNSAQMREYERALFTRLSELRNDSNSRIESYEFGEYHNQEFEYLKDDKIAVIERFAGDTTFLVQTLKYNRFELSSSEFAELLKTHPPLSLAFVYDMLMSPNIMDVDFIKLFIDARDKDSPLSLLGESRTGGKLALKLLSLNQIKSFVLAQELGLAIDKEASTYLYAALASGYGIGIETFESSDVNEALNIIANIAGRPSPADAIMLSRYHKEEPKDTLIRYGLDIDDFLVYKVNEDILDIEPEDLSARLSDIKNQWPNYILRLNPQSDCANESEFHWNDSTLIEWINERLKSPSDSMAIDDELAKFSRLYVERFRFFYTTRKLKVSDPQFNFNDEDPFIQKLFNVMASREEPSGINISELFSEPMTNEQEKMVKLLLISMVKQPKILEETINLGFSYNEKDMLDALRFQNMEAVKWLASMNIGYGGTDSFGNGVLYWAVIFDAFSALQKVDMNNIPKIYNTKNLNPHELHYAGCDSYALAPDIIREFEVAKDLKQQMRSDICERISGYTDFMIEQADQ